MEHILFVNLGPFEWQIHDSTIEEVLVRGQFVLLAWKSG